MTFKNDSQITKFYLNEANKNAEHLKKKYKNYDPRNTPGWKHSTTHLFD